MDNLRRCALREATDLKESRNLLGKIPAAFVPQALTRFKNAARIKGAL
jgi:hypothetical protein